MAYLRMPFCSPYKLFWPLAKSGPAASDVIHNAYARYVWSMHGLNAAPRVLVYSLLWPLPFAYLSWKHTRKLGGKVMAATGKGHARQVLEQFWVALRHSISPKKYYVYELFRPERMRNARHYIARYQFKGGLHNLLESRIENPTRRILNDKAAFFRHCEAAGVATAPTFLIVHQDGRLDPMMPINGILPKRNLFLKPLHGRGGRGCERWIYRDDDRYVDQNGTELDEAGLVERLRNMARSQIYKDYLVQEALAGHGALRDLSMNVLTSCRVMSVKNEHGGYEVTHAVFKSSTKPDAIVDNFHRGGIVSRVDVLTGELGPAS
ncbi:MAG: sugar-transfer associated ATP-grasp domain-containing protein, partial [Dongiaceae bacterium]